MICKILIELGFFTFVSAVTFCGLSFATWHFQSEVAVIARRKQILFSYMIGMSNLVVCPRESLTTSPARCCIIIVCLLSICQLCHVLVVDKYRLDGSAFAHYMVVKFVHNVRSTVHERVCLVLWIVSHSVACKAAHAVLVDRTSRLDRVYVFVFVDGSQKEFEIAN